MPRHITSWLQQREIGRGTSVRRFENKVSEISRLRSAREGWLIRRSSAKLAEISVAAANASFLYHQKWLKDNELANAALSCEIFYDEDKDIADGGRDLWPENYEPDGACVGLSEAEELHQRLEKDIKYSNLEPRIEDTLKWHTKLQEEYKAANYDDDINVHERASEMWKDYQYDLKCEQLDIINNLKRGTSSRAPRSK